MYIIIIVIDGNLIKCTMYIIIIVIDYSMSELNHKLLNIAPLKELIILRVCSVL